MQHKDFLAIGAKIYQCRKEKGWTQMDLAAAMNTDQQVISRHENDRDGKMSLRKVAHFADALGVSPYELVGMETPEGVVIANAKNIVHKLVEPQTISELMQVVVTFGSQNPDKMLRFVALVSMIYEKD